jgi:hypothetical protein
MRCEGWMEGCNSSPAFHLLDALAVAKMAGKMLLLASPSEWAGHLCQIRRPKDCGFPDTSLDDGRPRGAGLGRAVIPFGAT